MARSRLLADGLFKSRWIKCICGWLACFTGVVGNSIIFGAIEKKRKWQRSSVWVIFKLFIYFSPNRSSTVIIIFIDSVMIFFPIVIVRYWNKQNSCSIFVADSHEAAETQQFTAKQYHFETYRVSSDRTAFKWVCARSSLRPLYYSILSSLFWSVHLCILAISQLCVARPLTCAHEDVQFFFISFFFLFSHFIERIHWRACDTFTYTRNQKVAHKKYSTNKLNTHNKNKYNENENANK